MAYLSLVEPQQVHGTWPRVAILIAGACARSNGRYSAIDVKHLSESGRWQLWMLERESEVLAVCGSSIQTYPAGTKWIHFHYATGPSAITEMCEALESILDWAKSQGCVGAEGIFRPGWRRVLKGFRHTHEFLERAL